TYVYMLETYFADHYEGKNGEKKAKIWDENSIPTYNQFRYWYLKEYNFKKDFIGRYGELAFNLKHREILDYSTAEVDAPGAIYQIDATVADVYLVSSDNPLKVIGRPVVYIAIDVFSRIVCGLYVGLEGPSWLGAMMLLDNVVEDKIDFCSKYGIEIDEKEWPSKYLPEGIVADNGELEGYNADRLINNLNVPVINKPPYRGDLKGIVERHFRTINDRIKYTSPGAIQKEYRSRSDEDPRLKAEYTLDDFIKYMIIDVLWHNKHINRSYPLPKAMLNEDILPRPVDMWEWGMTRRKGRFNVYDRDIVRLNLLPTTTANITRAGIKFEDRFYSLDTAISEGWFTKGKNIRTQITYDPRNVNHIYLPNENGTGFKVANLLPKSYAYKDLSWEEARFARDSQNENYADAWREELQNDIDRDIATEEINKEAKARLKQAKKNQPEQSVNKRINNIQSNRSDAKQKRRKDEQFPPLGDSTPKEGRVLPFITNDETPETQTSSNKAQNDLMGKLLRKRDSIIGKDKE
ncbi:MAG TPA: Mu transposase C-terminal domain-containing protein, partial [Desulfosporosinus sp.]|nr:Mu transposase C-terminal domain-containing protein [Desulfosporosinus sp.]